MSLPKTSWPGMDCKVVCYVLRTTKCVADNIPDYGHPCLDNYFLSQTYVQGSL